MDAYDIFKKLSRGAKFNKSNKSSLHPKNAPKVFTNDVQVKEEITVVDDVKLEANEEQSQPNHLSDITILSTLNNSDLRRGKKRKIQTEGEVKHKQRMLEIEKVNHYRNINKISVVGKNIPEPAYTFDDYHIDEDLLQNLKNCGYTEPTPIQKQGVPVMLKGQELLACAPTGSGKTAAFLVPIIQQLKAPQNKGFRALIICPTRELAKQTQRECIRLSEGRNFRIHIISKIKKALEQYGPKSNKKYDILVTTPKRICFLLNQEPPAISLESVEWVVIDEADKLFEEGNRGFREQLDQIMTACSYTKRRIAMFSATCTPVVSKWCVRNMKSLVRVTVGHRNSATDTVDQKLLFVGDEHGKLSAFRDIVRNGILPPVLIFVQSKERARQLFNELIYDGIMVDAIHADRTQLQRDNTVKAFREGKIWVLICTELMARGVDFKGVNLVINYDFPPSSISYIHRVGRAGRAGRKGSAITFFTTEDVANLRSIAHILKESGCEVPPYMLTMEKKNKKERKKMEKSAPQRDDISTMPKYDVPRKRRKKNNLKPSKEGIVENNTSKNIEDGKKLLSHFKKFKDQDEKRKVPLEGKVSNSANLKNLRKGTKKKTKHQIVET